MGAKGRNLVRFRFDDGHGYAKESMLEQKKVNVAKLTDCKCDERRQLMHSIRSTPMVYLIILVAYAFSVIVENFYTYEREQNITTAFVISSFRYFCTCTINDKQDCRCKLFQAKQNDKKPK